MNGIAKRYSTEIFKINKVSDLNVNPIYSLTNFENDEQIIGRFTHGELYALPLTDEMLEFEIEKVISSRKDPETGLEEVYVKFMTDDNEPKNKNSKAYQSWLRRNFAWIDKRNIRKIS